MVSFLLVFLGIRLGSWKMSPHLLSHLTSPAALRIWTFTQHMIFFSSGLVPTHQHYSQNNTPKTDRGQRGPEYSFKKKDQLLIYKSSRRTEFSLKKIVIHNKYSTKKNLYLTVLVLSPRFQNVVWWAGGKKNTGKTA